MSDVPSGLFATRWSSQILSYSVRPIWRQSPVLLGFLWSWRHKPLTRRGSSGPKGAGDGPPGVNPALASFKAMESALYQPVKASLEAAGYQAKGEIGGCDIVGLSPGEPPVVVVCELKLSFNLELVLQAVDR